MRVHWSADPAAGLTEIWRDGALSSTATGHVNGGVNLYRDSQGSEQGYLEQGIYMPNDNRQSARDRVVWQVGMRIATSIEDIAAEQAGWAEALGRTVDPPGEAGLRATTGAATKLDPILGDRGRDGNSGGATSTYTSSTGRRYPLWAEHARRRLARGEWRDGGLGGAVRPRRGKRLPLPGPSPATRQARSGARAGR